MTNLSTDKLRDLLLSHKSALLESPHIIAETLQLNTDDLLLRHLAKLRQEIEKRQSELDWLINNAKHNESSSREFFDFYEELLFFVLNTKDSLPIDMVLVLARLSSKFNLILALFWQSSNANSLDVDSKECFDVLKLMRNPVCDAIENISILSGKAFIPKDAQSVAILPVGVEGPFDDTGVLLLFDRDRTRFTVETETVLLKRLANLFQIIFIQSRRT